ncbi:hypothetical protein R6Z07M_014062 [Ovis aries]
MKHLETAGKSGNGSGSAIAYRQGYCHCSLLCSKPPSSCCLRGVMGFWKFLPFLVLSFLVVYQAGMFQAAPFRSALENDFDPAILTEKEMCLLLAAVMNDYVQMKTSELKQETEDLRITAQKRSCNRATCVTHKMAGSLSRSGSEIKRNFMSTNVGSKAFGQRSRDLQN